MHDLVFDGASIVDGTGAPAFHGSVGILGDRIVQVSDGPLAGRRVIHLEGRTLAPGFIDLHTHSDFTLPAYPAAAAMLRQGVTTQVVGNCGFSPFPTSERGLDEWRAATSWLDAGLDWDACRDPESFFAYVQGRAPACNVAFLVGHGAVRTAVMGSAGRIPTGPELDEMRGHVASAMRAGAVGMSSGLTYAPGVYAEPREIHALARVVADHGGFYASHLRNESQHLIDALDEIISVASATGVAVQISHLKALGREHWPLVDVALERLDAALQADLDVVADQYPYTAGSTTLAVHTPPWARTDGTGGMQRLLGDADARTRIRAEILAQDPVDVRKGLRRFEPDSIRIAQVPRPLDPVLEGRTLTEVALDRDEAPVDTLLWFLQVGGGSVLATVHSLSEDRVRQVMAHPMVAVASDGWTLDRAVGGKPHPRSYGTFARVLGRYVRDDAVLGLEDAVRKMTSLPARRLDEFDLGMIRSGARADLVAFDPATVIDRATYTSPHEFASGVQHVVVGGQLVVEDGVQTEARPGTVLRTNPV